MAVVTRHGMARRLFWSNGVSDLEPKRLRSRSANRFYHFLFRIPEALLLINYGYGCKGGYGKKGTGCKGEYGYGCMGVTLVRVGMGMGMGNYGYGCGRGCGCNYGWDERCDDCRPCGLLRFFFCFVKKRLPIAEMFHALPDWQDRHLVVPVHELCEFNPWRDSQTIAQTWFSCTVS